MKLFLIKKTFFDMWDNLLRIVIMNLGFLVLSVLIFYFIYLMKGNIVLFFTGIFISFIVFNLYYGTVSLFVLKIADYESPGFKDFLLLFKKSWIISILYSFILSTVLLVLFAIIPFYFRFNNYPGLFISFLLLWMTAVLLLSIQYFYQIYGRLNNKFGHVFKTCFIIFFDNTGFSIYLVLGSIIILALSILTGFIFPGISTLLLWQSDGFKIRLYKYQYLEENPDADRKKIPWNTIIKNDKETIGRRTFRNTIFPWRE